MSIMTQVPKGIPEQERPKASGSTDPAPPGYVTMGAFLEAGLSYRRLDYWTRVGYLKAVQDSVGSGFRRIWPLEELGVAIAILRLVESAGIELTKAVEIARGPRPAAGSWDVRVLTKGLRLIATPDLWQP